MTINKKVFLIIPISFFLVLILLMGNKPTIDKINITKNTYTRIKWTHENIDNVYKKIKDLIQYKTNLKKYVRVYRGVPKYILNDKDEYIINPQYLSILKNKTIYSNAIIYNIEKDLAHADPYLHNTGYHLSNDGKTPDEKYEGLWRNSS